MKISKLPKKEFKTTVIKMLPELGNQWRIRKYQKNQSELDNTTEIKYALEEINSRLGGTNKCISKLEGRRVETFQNE